MPHVVFGNGAVKMLRRERWPRLGRLRRYDFSGLRKECDGTAAAEFALIVPVLLLVIFGIIQYGITFNHYIELANGVASGARALAVARGTSTAYSDTLAAVNGGAPNLNSFSSPTAGQTLSIVVAGTSCTAANQASTCASAFAEGAKAVVTATYPCNLDVMWITIPGCSLTSAATEYVQ